METIGHNNSFIPCDICYKEIINKVTLECKHELCVMCFLKITTSTSKGQIIPFKCHMCRKQYEWKKDNKGTHIFSHEETLSIHIREDEGMTLSFRALVGMEANKTFEVIIQEQYIIHFIVILGSQTDTETLKFLISEFIANNIPIPYSTEDDIIQNLRTPAAFSHFKNTGSHLETFYNNLVIKKYEG